MERLLYKQLKNWKSQTNRKPLLLQGGRQVGKTYLLKDFANREYDDFSNIPLYAVSLLRQYCSSPETPGSYK